MINLAIKIFVIKIIILKDFMLEIIKINRNNRNIKIDLIN